MASPEQRAACYDCHKPLFSAVIWQHSILCKSFFFTPEESKVAGDFMRIAMIGTGYVGLVSGACLSEFGHDVVCIDKDAGEVETLRSGGIPIYEPGLDEVVAANVKAARLSFETDLARGVAGDAAIFIAVGTPSRRGDGHADLSYVFAAAEEIAKSLAGYAVVVTKSTVPAGTSRKVEEIIKKTNPNALCDTASNPQYYTSRTSLVSGAPTA
jgi:UDPglucose 6-dehydrogenase